MPHSWEGHLDHVHAAAAEVARVFAEIDTDHHDHAQTLTGARLGVEQHPGSDGETDSPASGSRGDRGR